MLEEKKICDIIDITRLKPTTTAQTKRKEKDNTITSKIIKKKLNSNLYTNIIGEQDPNQSWKSL